MFGWLSGTQGAAADMEDRHAEDRSSDYHDEAPETPAALFAVRAFKQAIWGTPKPGETAKRPAQRRRRTLGKDLASAPAVPAPGNARVPRSGDVTPLNSPSKRPGILVTPGTAGKGRKTVSFEARQRALQSKTPTETNVKTDDKAMDLFKRLHSLRGSEVHEPTKPATKASDLSKGNTSTGMMEADWQEEEDKDYGNPRSPSGRHWKSTYETYLRTSEVEMRKLVKKEQLAKNFAKFKDIEALKLKEELDKERKKVELLEARIDEYVRKLGGAISVGTDAIKHGDAEQSVQGELYDSEKGSDPRRQGIREASTKSALDVQRRQTRNGDSFRFEFPAVTDSRPASQRRSECFLPRKQQDHMNSGIWADIGDPPKPSVDSPIPLHNVSELSTQRVSATTPRSSRRTVAERRPLESTSGNTGASVSSKSLYIGNTEATKANAGHGATTKGKADIMSEERKQAARRRLEERKRIRESKGAAAAAV